MARVSIAEARHNLAALIHRAEEEQPVEITRRGAPVAVLLSMRDYSRLTAARQGFNTALENFLHGSPQLLPDGDPFFFLLSVTRPQVQKGES